MNQSAIDRARSCMRRRQFERAITILNSRPDFYEDSFDYFFTLGTAYLYAGDAGSAVKNYDRARQIRMTDTRLLLGQAAIFLRRGETDRAIQYYLDVLDNAPGDKRAKKALEFLRHNDDYEKICKWADDGRIERFYPPVGANPNFFIKLILVLCLGALCGYAAVRSYAMYHIPKNTRGGVVELVLTEDDKVAVKDAGGAPGAYRFSMSEREIIRTYEKAAYLFQQYRDNAAQVEVNRILNSNASPKFKQKARLLMEYFSTPTFATLKDNYPYIQVAQDVFLYLDCWVDWTGHVANFRAADQGVAFDLIIGSDDMKKVDGFVPVVFNSSQTIKDFDKSVRVLGKLTLEGSSLKIVGQSVYQSPK